MPPIIFSWMTPKARYRAPDDPDVRLSKTLSRLLRHAPPPGAMDAQGWVAVPVLLMHLKHLSTTEEQLRRVVDSNEKKRFVLDDSTNPIRIRAAQGHSVELENPVLEEVILAASVPVAVHVTSQNSWQAIQESRELRRMARTHIHFATQPHHMRANQWAQVALQLDLQAALNAGHRFFLSTNQVLLVEGPLQTQFIKRVNWEELPEAWGAGSKKRGASGEAGV